VEAEDESQTSVDDQENSTELPETVAEKWKRKRNSGSKSNKSNQNFEEQFLTIFQTSTQEDEDRSFLESLLPTLRQFNTDQKLLFRSKVIQNMMEIKKQIHIVPTAVSHQETTNHPAPIVPINPVYAHNDYSTLVRQTVYAESPTHAPQDTNYLSTSYLTNDNHLTQTWYPEDNRKI